MLLKAKKKWVHKSPLKAMESSLLSARVSVPQANPRAGMDRLLKDMEANKGKSYEPKIQTAKKQVRVIVAGCGVGCEECLNRPAVIYSAVFKTNLCEICEEKLLVDAGAAYLESKRSRVRFKKKRRTS